MIFTLFGFALKMLKSKYTWIILLVLGSCGGLIWVGWHLRGPEVAVAKAETKAQIAKNAAERAEAKAHAAQVEKDAAIEVVKVNAEAAAKQAQIKIVYKEIRHDVPILVPAALDYKYPVSNGFVCVWNETASAVNSSTTPCTPCESPDTPSTIPISAVASTVVDAGNVCAQYKARADAWEQFYLSTMKVWNADTSSK